MTLQEFNSLSEQDASHHLINCCGSRHWVQKMLQQCPFATVDEMHHSALQTWYFHCDSEDWKEAFRHHPKIGDLESLKKKFAGQEQASVALASAETISQLAKMNAAYEHKFGYIFIVCATGKQAYEMLALLNNRIPNTASDELRIAMGEQAKITALRINKLLDLQPELKMGKSQITTHVLNTSTGRPGAGIKAQLFAKQKDTWQLMAQGITDDDGRIGDLLPPGKTLDYGIYKMRFDTASYYEQHKISGFYPEVEIQFTINSEEHYHIPLLLSPFGYTTYRGS